ncbi:MAG: hypothetical protein K0Q49_1976 [Haloplasmataceae bacterium]|jgi:predicted enzyme related to lactoylglutathione lyase|nr:hypothetical protein [Haloplasmataceae bacterium]
MKLVFLYQPVKNIEESMAYYKGVLGFEEAWREGEHTAALKLPNSDVKLMIEDDGSESEVGGMFLVDSVDKYYKENKEKIEFVKKPMDIPPGRYATFKDISGNIIRILDFSKE